MGYAAYRAVHYGTSPLNPASTIRAAKHGATLYTIQLGLNLAWMPLFFVARRPAEAAADLVALVGINSYLAYLWGSVDRVAGWCLVPYVAWLGFGAYLAVGVGHLSNWNLSDKETSKDEKQA
jgi:benzodiazapine receptor